MNALDSYTTFDLEEARDEIFRSLITPLQIHPVADPQGVLLGGQSGAGKTTLHYVFRKKLKNNVVVINGDEYRKLHPHYDQLKEAYGDDWVAHTAAWSGAVTEALIDVFSSQNYNLLVEGTLRTSETPLKTARLLKERGYEVSLALMAVKPEISLISCQIRYEEMRIAGTDPRSVDPMHHNHIIKAICDNLAVLEDSGLFTYIYLFSRSKEQLYPTIDVNEPASNVLKTILFGPFSEEEESHKVYLEEKLNRLKAMN